MTSGRSVLSGLHVTNNQWRHEDGGFKNRTSGPQSRWQPVALSRADPVVSDARAETGIHACESVERARRCGFCPPACDKPSAARGEDRHGISRLWAAGGRPDFRGQSRHDACGEEIRAGKRLPACHLCDVVDQGGDPGIYPAVMVAGQNRHHRRPEEAVLQPAADQGPDPGH